MASAITVIIYKHYQIIIIKLKYYLMPFNGYFHNCLLYSLSLCHSLTTPTPIPTPTLPSPYLTQFLSYEFLFLMFEVCVGPNICIGFM